MIELITRRDLFIREYLKDFNGTQAAIRAGYSPDSARDTAHELLTNPNIREQIARLAYEQAKSVEIDGRRILEELAAIAFSPVTELIRASDKTKALNLLGIHAKLWEGSRGDRIINITMTNIDLRTM